MYRLAKCTASQTDRHTDRQHYRAAVYNLDHYY